MPIIGRGKSPISIRRGGDGLPAVQVWHNGICLFDGTMPATVIAITRATVLLGSGSGLAGAAGFIAGSQRAAITVAGTGETSEATAGGTPIGAVPAQITLGPTTAGTLVAGAVVSGDEGADVAVSSGSGVAGTTIAALVEGNTSAFVVFLSSAGSAWVAATAEALSRATVTLGSESGTAAGAVVVAGVASAATSVAAGSGVAVGDTAVVGVAAADVAVTSGSGQTAITIVDEFNRTVLGSDWTLAGTGTAYVTLDGSSIGVTAGGNRLPNLRYTAESMPGDDCELEITIASTNGTVNGFAMCRVGVNFSSWVGIKFVPTGVMMCRGTNASSNTAIGTLHNTTITAGTRLGLRCVGTSLELLVDGEVVQTATDSTHQRGASYRQIGMIPQATSGGSSPRIDRITCTSL